MCGTSVRSAQERRPSIGGRGLRGAIGQPAFEDLCTESTRVESPVDESGKATSDGVSLSSATTKALVERVAEITFRLGEE